MNQVLISVFFFCHYLTLSEYFKRPYSSRHNIKPVHSLLGTGENVGVTSIQDGHGRATEELTASGTKLNLSSKKSIR